jgi:coenzyme F420-dependent glucose-6-phosphate dehydrogenase
MRSTPRFGYHASHEQFAPSALLRYAELAEKAGFDTVKSSDHFHPWSGGCHAWRALSRSAMGGGGDGEAINEAITGETWPDKAERNARLLECVEVIRALMAGETVTHRGRIRVLEARLYSRPISACRFSGCRVRSHRQMVRRMGRRTAHHRRRHRFTAPGD